MMIWIGYAACGVVAGVLAGLLGVGGGIVIVPMLNIVFALQGVDEAVIQHMALATSMGTIAFTSISSFRSHHKRGAVDWSVVRRITPGILAGTFLGTWVASLIPTRPLKAVFVVFLYVVSTQMLMDAKPKPGRGLPGAVGMTSMGGLIGVLSALVGIGGGSLSVPFMVWCNMTIHNAVGTSAAIGFPIAVAGALGFIVNGLGDPALPPMSLGYISIPATVGIAAVSVFTAPLGARLAHRLPVKQLKRAFALILMVMATRMLYKLFF